MTVLLTMYQLSRGKLMELGLLISRASIYYQLRVIVALLLTYC